MFNELLERFESLYNHSFERKLDEDEYHMAEMCAVLLHAQYTAVNDQNGLRLLDVTLRHIRDKRPFFDDRTIGALDLDRKKQKEVVCVGCVERRIDCWPVIREKRVKREQSNEKE